MRCGWLFNFGAAIWCVTLGLGWCWLLPLTVSAALPRTSYQARVKEAAQLAQSVAENAERQNALTVRQLTKLLPATEDITDKNQIIRVDNSWLQVQLAQLSPVSPDEDEDDTASRKERWEEIANYLRALNERVRDAQTPLPANFQLEHNRLENILARSEYQTDNREASGLQQWLKNVARQLMKWLREIFRSSELEPNMPGKGTVTVARVIIIVLLIAALAFALYQLSRWWERRQPKGKKEKSREILGVEITDETTTDDLLAAARELAQQGDFRGAIRRAYLALLYELEQRGKLRLHRSKTNRDYLQAMRHETALYPAFAALTHNFERVWYGQTLTSQTEYEGFLNGYQQTLKTEN